VLKDEPINLLGVLNWGWSGSGRGIVIYTVLEYLGMREAEFAFVLQRLRAPVMRSCRIWNCRQEGGNARLGIYWYSTRVR